MKFFKNFLSLFKKDRKKQQIDDAQVEVSVPSGVKRILRLPYLVVHPNDVLQGLCMAVVMDTCKMYGASADEVKLYELHEKENENEKSFLGSCWALRVGDRYYANVIGSDEVFAFERGEFLLKKTDRIWVPVQKNGNEICALICRFEQSTANIIPLFFNKVCWEAMLNIEVIKTFDGNTSFYEAMKFYKAILQ